MALRSWLDIDPSSGFGLENLPFGIFSTNANPKPRVGVAVGSFILDMARLSTHARFPTVFPLLADHPAVLYASSLNAFAALGRTVHRAVRSALQAVLAADTPHGALLRDDAAMRAAALIRSDAAAVTMHLPVAVGDYTDFYAGFHHAFHIGTMVRGPEQALQQNYLNLPVAYHGRASSIVVSGTPIRRPMGQILDSPAQKLQTQSKATEAVPITALSRRLDFELELGCIIGAGNAHGENIGVADAEDHIFGYVLLNDWSARDIQTWEYVPLGPFNSKNFATSISAWVVLADALEPFRTEALTVQAKPECQPYLREKKTKTVFNILLEVELTTR
ncbi:hypothetical protein TD95_002805, partial [Thielaviopsis punctulata]